MTKAQIVAADIAALLRARNPLLWIVTREEARAERYLFEACASAGYVARTWNVASGILESDGSGFDGGRNLYTDPGEALAFIEGFQSRGQRCAWVMRDLHDWLDGPSAALTRRALRNVVRTLPTLPRDKAQAIIVLSPSSNLPAEIAAHATVIDWPLPDRAEIASILDVYLAQYGETVAPNGTQDAAIDAAVGLSASEAEACYAKSLVQTKRIDPAAVAKEKKRVIARERVLEWFDPLPGGLGSVGGLEGLKSWLRTRAVAYGKQAREYGLPAPKGVFLVGVPGCGKSLTAKAIATAWGVPLLRLDLNALKSKFVGESEGNLRRALQTIEAIGRCVVWLDEIEKALSGATQGAADGGVSSDALGTILNWMQERSGEAFVVATANDVEALPPELLRKGRFDEMFFVDTPNALERESVLKAAISSNGRAAILDTIHGPTVAKATDGFTGAEIAALVPDALYSAFADGAREITTVDLVEAARNVVPLAKTASEKITRLRAWAASRCRPATDKPKALASVAPSLRAVEI
jgi:SpoVK/Ycf46/Vps4 family AAA+-type ATPase